MRNLKMSKKLLVGFGSERDRIHAPNESYGLEQFERTMTWAEMILKALAQLRDGTVGGSGA